MFLAASVISCFLGGILAACVGFALTERRSVGECEHGEDLTFLASLCIQFEAAHRRTEN